VKTCEQCFEEYEPGKGATEPGPTRVRLTERFCTESCAEEWDEQMGATEES
jgi:hypothetical protein